MIKCPPNPNARKFILPVGYRDIGWQLSSDNPDLLKCIAAGHKYYDSRTNTGEIREFDNSLFLMRCTDVIRICDICKMVYHTDMND